jgi:glucosamine kinase
MTGRLFVGIDGGGTRARALLTDDHGTELARVIGPAGILRPEDPALAAAVMQQLTSDVLEAGGCASAGVSALCCALAGAGRDVERDALRIALMVGGVANEVLVVGDAEAMITDAFAEGAGVLLIAGTGSIAWARDVSGVSVRVGGWGLLLGDEGSGYDIGRHALRATARAADGRAPQTVLSTRVVEQVGGRIAADLITWAARASKSDVAQLAPLVLRAADDGDDIATGIRANAVAELCLLVTTAVQVSALERPRVALAGGLIDPAGPLREHVSRALEERIPGCLLHDRMVDGARGATVLARRSAAAI